MWQNTATKCGTQREPSAYPDKMAQSKTTAGVPDSQSPHPDSCSLSPLHPFFSTKIALSFYFFSFYSMSFHFCIFALSLSAFMKVREVFFKFLCSLPLVHEEMFQFLLHWSMQPCESTPTQHLGKGYFQLKPDFYSWFSLLPHPVEHLSDGRPDCSFAETHFVSQGVTSLAGQRWCQIAENRAGALRPSVANGVCWRG